MSRLKPLILMFYVLVAPACASDFQSPQRPGPVPKDAMWIGGADGGAWVLLKKHPGDPRHIYRAEIYGDQVGDKWYIGRLEVVPNAEPDVPLDDSAAFGVWDGDNLLLEDGRTMRAIDQYDPFKN